MDEPSLLRYARHYGLAKDYSQYIQTLSRLGSTWQFDLQDTMSARSPQVELCDSSNHAHTILWGEDYSLPLSADADALLKKCQEPALVDHGREYQRLLANPAQSSARKLVEPLLFRGGGNPVKDAQRIRAGVDCQAILEIQQRKYIKVLEDTLAGIETPTVDFPGVDAVDRVFRRLYGLDGRIRCTPQALRIIQKMKQSFSRAETSVAHAGSSSLLSPAISKQRLRDANLELHVQDLEQICENDLQGEQKSPVLPKIRIPTWSDLSSEVSSENDEVEVASNINIRTRTNGTTAISKMVDNVLEYVDNYDPDRSWKRKREFESEDEFCPDDIVWELRTSDTTNRCSSCHRTATKPEANREHPENGIKTSCPFQTPSPTRMTREAPRGPPQHGMKLALPVLHGYRPIVSRLRSMRSCRPQVAVSTVAPLSRRPASFEALLPLPSSILPDALEAIKPVIPTEVDGLSDKPRNVPSSESFLWKEPGLRVLDHDSDNEEIVMDKDILSSDSEVELHSPTKVIDVTSSSMASASLCRSQDNDILPGKEPKSTVTQNENVPLGRKEEPYVDMESPDTHDARYERDRSPAMKDFLDEKSTITSAPDFSRRHIAQKANIKVGLSHSVMSARSPAFSAASSLHKFLGLRSKVFLKPFQNHTLHTIEDHTDPIEASQHARESDGLPIDAESTLSWLAQRSEEPPCKSVRPLETPRTVIYNNALLRSKVILVRFLEGQAKNNLEVISRSFTGPVQLQPDLLIGPSWCVVVAHLQTFSQRPLPGQISRSGLSSSHDRVLEVASKYQKVSVVVPFLDSHTADQGQNVSRVKQNLGKFCNDIAQGVAAQNMTSLVDLVWVCCASGASTADNVNNAVWELIKSKGWNNRSTTGQLQRQTEHLRLMQHETMWETSLVQLGVDHFSAQIIIAVMKTQHDREHDKISHEATRKFIQLSPEARLNLFGNVLEKATLERINVLLSL